MNKHGLNSPDISATVTTGVLIGDLKFRIIIFKILDYIIISNKINHKELARINLPACPYPHTYTSRDNHQDKGDW